MTATMLPALPSFGAMGLGLHFGSGPTAPRNNDAIPVLPPVGALLSLPMMRPVVRARSADDVAPPRPKKATPALAQFAADWNRLPRSHARFADGAAILHKVNPRNVDAKAIEVLPQNLNTEAAQGNGLSALMRSSELDLVQTELENLSQDRCVCAAGPGADLRGVPEDLERGEPIVVGVHAPLADGLGAIVAPIRLPQPQQHPSAVVLGAGAIARTTTPSYTPILTRQVVGRSLVVHWVPVSRAKIPHGTSFMAATSRMMSGAKLRSVVLAPGQWCVLPKGSVYVTLALGDNATKFAAQVKFAIHLPSSASTNDRARTGEKRKADHDDGYESHSSYSGSYQDSYAGSVQHDSDIEEEKDCDNCNECRSARSSKRARTEEDDRNDFTTTPPTTDYTVTRTRDSFDSDKNDHATASPSISPRFHNRNNNLFKHNTTLYS